MEVAGLQLLVQLGLALEQVAEAAPETLLCRRSMRIFENNVLPFPSHSVLTLASTPVRLLLNSSGRVNHFGVLAGIWP